MKQRTNTYRNLFSRSYENRSISDDFLMKADTQGTGLAQVVRLRVIVPHPDLVTAETKANHSLMSCLQKSPPCVNQAPVVLKFDSANELVS